MVITNKLLTQVDLPVWEWMKFAPVNTSSLSCLTTDKDGKGRYLIYFASPTLYRYDTWGDTWQQLSTIGTAVTTVDTEMVKNQGFRGNVLSVPSSTSLQIPSTGGANLAGYTIRIVSGKGAGQTNTILSSNSEVVVDSGISTTSTGANAIFDSLKKWKYNQWVGYSVRVIYGTGFSQFRQIIYNDPTSLTVFDANYDYKNFQMAAFSALAPYALPVTTNSMYSIVSQVINLTNTWGITPDSTSKFQILSGGIWWISANAATPFFNFYYYDILSDTFTQKLTPTNLITAALGTDFTVTSTAETALGGLISSTGTTATSITFTDSTLTGVTNNDYSGMIIKITGGTGNGQSRRIYSNTSNTFRLSKKWDTIPDATSSYIISAEDAIYLEGNARSQLLKYLPEPNIWANGNVLENGLTMNLGLLKSNPNNNIGVTSATIATGGITGVASVPTAAGSGYAIGDLLTISVGSLGRVYVESIDALGRVLSVSLFTAGNTYTTGTGKVTTGGSGAGCTINITSTGNIGVLTTSIIHDLVINDSVSFTGATESAWNTSYNILGIQSSTVVEIPANGTLTAVPTYALATTLLVDLTKSWTPNEHVGKLLGLQSNTLTGTLTFRRIIGNSTNTISFILGVAPTNGNSRYFIQDLDGLGKDLMYIPTQQQPIGFATSGLTGSLVDSTKSWIPNTYTNNIIRLVDTSSTNEIQDILTYNTNNILSIGRTIGLGIGTNTLGYSDDNGITWTGNGATIFTTQGNGAVWSGTKFVAAGSGTNTLAWSNDGITWNGLAATIFGTQGNDVAYNGTRFVAVGSGTNTLAWSNDGTNWNALTTFSTVGNAVVWMGSKFVAGGQATNSLAYSTDGITWTTNGNTIFSTSCLALSWNGTRVVAGGAGSVHTLAYSNDGINFTGNSKTIFSTQCNGIAWNGNIFVAVGSGTNSIAYSYDGIGWTGVTSSTSIFTTGNSVAWNGIRFVAGGTVTNSLAYSTDGINWTSNGITIFTTSCFGLASTSPFASLTPNIGLIPTTATTYTIYDVSGQSTATSTALQLVDTNKKWKTNQWVNKKLLITSSTGVQQEILIASNTTNTLTFASSTSPDATSTYTILGRPALSTGLGLEWNWGTTNISNKGKYLISNRGGGTAIFDTYDFRTNRWTYGDFIFGQGEPLNTGSMFAYDGVDRIYFQATITGRIFYYDMVRKCIEPFGMVPYGMGAAILGNRIETITTNSGLNYLYIMRHSTNEMWRTLIYY